MELTLIIAVLMLIVLVFVIMNGMVVSKKLHICEVTCCGCLRQDSSHHTRVRSKDSNESAAAVQLRVEAGRSGIRAYTWPWKNRRPSGKCSRGKGSDIDSAVIFSSNSLCLKVERDDDDFEKNPVGVLSLLASHNEEDGEVFRKDEMSLHSVMIDFEEEVLKGVSELKTEAGMSDSLKNVAGSLMSVAVKSPPTMEGAGRRVELAWEGQEGLVGAVIMTKDGENGVCDIECTGAEGVEQKSLEQQCLIQDVEDAVLVISDELKDEEVFESGQDEMTAPSGGNEMLDISGMVQPFGSTSMLKYRYSLAREEILCCSSNTSSLALESPWNIGNEDICGRFHQRVSDLLQEELQHSTHPLMLYRYSISLEEFHIPSHQGAGIHGLLKPLPSSAASDEDTEVFYDALSSFGSARSSLIAQNDASLPVIGDEQPSKDNPNRAVLRRSMYHARPSEELAPVLRRCSSLQNL